MQLLGSLYDSTGSLAVDSSVILLLGGTYMIFSGIYKKQVSYYCLINT